MGQFSTEIPGQFRVEIYRYGHSNDFSLPAGGFKKSCIDKDLSRKAYEASLKPKTMLIEF